jgi:uncharacterized protein (DUF2252 family)
MTTADPIEAMPAPRKVVHLTRDERAARGKQARQRAPLAGHEDPGSAEGRPDPVALLESQAATREPDLVPIRYGRMLTSPFAFYRGAALIMARDLATRSDSGLRVQLCGDAHATNFGVFASPERRLVFDANDFDETLPGPFEWDVKRLAASLEVAGRDNGFKAKERRNVVLEAVRSYREAMRVFAAQTNMTVWYSSLDAESLLSEVGSQLRPQGLKRTEAELAKARTRDSTQALSKLTTTVDGRIRIVNDPPLVVPVEDLLPDQDVERLYQEIRLLVGAYRRSLQPDRRILLEQFRLVQMARKVVGVGSVGTRAWILLMEGVDGKDPLFLQAKEAQRSVLEQGAGASRHANQGQRVVLGQRLMQAASDVFLGWQRSLVEGVARDYYLRQLRDWKASIDLSQMVPNGMTVYGKVCAWSLARAHARSGDRIAIAAYLGKKDTFDQAVARFATDYADRNEADAAALADAVRSGRITAVSGV